MNRAMVQTSPPNGAGAPTPYVATAVDLAWQDPAAWVRTLAAAARHRLRYALDGVAVTVVPPEAGLTEPLRTCLYRHLLPLSSMIPVPFWEQPATRAEALHKVHEARPPALRHPRPSPQGGVPGAGPGVAVCAHLLNEPVAVGMVPWEHQARADDFLKNRAQGQPLILVLPPAQGDEATLMAWATLTRSLAAPGHVVAMGHPAASAVLSRLDPGAGPVLALGLAAVNVLFRAAMMQRAQVTVGAAEEDLELALFLGVAYVYGVLPENPPPAAALGHSGVEAPAGPDHFLAGQGVMTVPSVSALAAGVRSVFQQAPAERAAPRTAPGVLSDPASAAAALAAVRDEIVQSGMLLGGDRVMLERLAAGAPAATATAARDFLRALGLSA